MIRYWVGLLLVTSFSGSVAQIDTTTGGKVLSLDEFFQVVLAHHPVAQQAYLLDDFAQADLRLARGYFDPTLKSNLAIKEFGGTTYYNTWDSKLEVPLWLPADLNVGYEQNRGEYLNNERSNTENGLLYAGVSVPIGRGLLIDQRRTAVKTARLMQDMAVAEQIKEINKLLLSAAKAYWDWYYAYEAYQAVDEIEQLAETRYRGIVRQVINGDVAPFDSLKAYINYQDRDVQRTQAALELENARLSASVFLWQSSPEGAIPLDVSATTVPALPDSTAPVTAEALAELRTLARKNHPELTKVSVKIQQLQIEQRLNREYLKPEVNLKYNFLARSLWGDEYPLFGSNTSYPTPWLSNNYKAGIEFYFPLFLRKERAKIAKTRVKMEENFFERSYLLRTIENDINQAYNTLHTLRQVVSMQTRMVDNYRTLLRGELRKFEFGESSVFLVNTRETELLEARIKLLKLQAQYGKAKLELQYAAGVPRLTGGG